MKAQHTKQTIPPDVARNPFKRARWIKTEIRAKGYTQAELAKEWGNHPSTLRSAWAGGGYCALQERTAAFLGVEVRDLFPELYDADTGRRILSVRGSKRTTSDAPVHVQNAGG